MSVKQIKVHGLGKVKLYKRRGVKSVKLSVAHDNSVRVSLPLWMPYQAGLAFAKSKAIWIKQNQKPLFVFSNDTKIGKHHTIKYIKSRVALKPRVEVTHTEVRVELPFAMSQYDCVAQVAATRGAENALKEEATNILAARAKSLAKKHGFVCNEVNVKNMQSRWGSCSHAKTISLNIYLMNLDWQLIDYVILHELTHTKYLDHGLDFWNHLNTILPDTKYLRKQLNTKHPIF